MSEATTRTPVAPATDDTAHEGGVLWRLYSGAGGINIIGRSKLWFSIAAGVVVVALLAMVIRGFTLGIDFEGGTRMTMPAEGTSIERAEEIFTEATGTEPEQVQIVGSGEGRVLEITSERIDETQIATAREELYTAFEPKDASGQESPDAIGDSTVSESWGSSITERMLLAAAVFLVLVFAYITFRFERDMAIAAIACLALDGVVIMGVYSLTGLEVTPATVIGLLTVLAFSLYDTVVIFDKVEENTAGFKQSTRRTYGELVNLAVNQSVMRSINTTISTLLPVASLLVIAVWALGVGTLADLAVIQFIGIIQGTFSSILFASPLLVALKGMQRDYRKHNQQVLAARSGAGSSDEAAASAEAAQVPDQAHRRPAEPAGDAKANGSTPLSWRPGM
ncbi:protein translocase subunit SecF [Corynebacterium sp. TAE3-ERU12]|uniref:protein translocase subunit SecF n=1 Tax=Corynebacterium sp. TAE3-ERU12 TaxID=2849491 RepID=UPI001C43DC5D|nr:protein translocase subunit SecF [Corynebacterium sp. TAE3-ERU12]MBV7295359.1 protein translocase subunit SecF [Corynebacterium sp. TAE3-ERU12]